MQIVAVSSSLELPESNEGVHEVKNIVAAMVVVRRQEHVDLVPMS